MGYAPPRPPAGAPPRHSAFFAEGQKPSPNEGVFGTSKQSKHRQGEPLTAQERKFIENAYPALGPAAIASKLGRSRSGVCYVIKQLKDSGVIESNPATNETSKKDVPGSPPHDAEDGRQDTLGRLRWVRSLLERQLYDAEPTSAARLAKEYRDTIEAIDRLEKDGGGENDIIGQFADVLAKRLG